MDSQKTVFVGISGGVDSSLSAAILKERGYKVVGVYMKNWTQDFPGFVCPWMDDFKDAQRVAVTLGIDLKVFDFEDQYKQKVVDYMIGEYKAGRTPNPDIMCNQEIKFKLFLDTAVEEGADLIATGHYAKVLRSSNSSQLHIAKDGLKDQTYFLYRVSQDALEKTIFPIGDFASKAEVRAAAKKFKLPTANKKDSQGICFVGKVGIKEFLKQYVSAIPGEIINDDGQVIGQHEGAIFYTIGQRHGLSVGGGLPYYVTSKDMARNQVFVTTDLSSQELWSEIVEITDLHWINNPPDPKTSYRVKLRYRGPFVSCRIEIKGKVAKIHLDDGQRAVAPGQSAVIYDGERVVGGGVISRAT